jgi:hypothetical protein
MPSLKVGRSMLVVAGCSVLALVFFGEAQSREVLRGGARSKALIKEAPAPKDKASPSGWRSDCVAPPHFPKVQTYPK